MRILVVEDEQKVASFIKKGLEEEGYAVDVAADGEEGLALGLARVHDLIVLDIRLPKLDGLRVLQGLRRVSRPGLRVYSRTDRIPRVQNGLGVAILSTSKGVVTGEEARAQAVGGEVLAYIW